jgi:hypothetical protein
LSYKIVLIHLLFGLLFQVFQLIIQKSIFLFQRTTFSHRLPQLSPSRYSSSPTPSLTVLRMALFLLFMT